MATSVRPMTASDTPSARAMVTEPLTSRLAPTARPSRPPSTNSTAMAAVSPWPSASSSSSARVGSQSSVWVRAR